MGTELFNQAKPILEKIEQHGFEDISLVDR